MWPFSRKRIYLDHAAATPVCKEAARAYAQAAKEYGNPGSIHAEGVAAKQILDEARATIARELAVKPRQIIFASGSTEGNNLCIVGMARQVGDTGSPTFWETQCLPLAGTHWIVSAIEHPSVLESFAEVERLGGAVSHLDPDSSGLISADALAHAIRPETVLVSVGWGNHEIGTVQPLRALVHAVHERAKTLGIATPFFHSDLGQAPLYLSPQMNTLGIDMAVFGSGKLYGPRGIGAVYLSNRAELSATSFGGGQERELRAGTESPALAAGFAAAMRAAGERRHAESARITVLRDELADRIASRIPGAVLNTSPRHALPHILNVSIPGIQGEYVVLALDRAGIAISTKSACNAGDVSSHVVAALGNDPERAKTTLRFSLGAGTTRKDVTVAADALSEIISRTGFSTG